MRQLWALVHAASACEKSLFSVATRGRSAEGSEIAISFIYVSKVCQSCHQYVLEPANLCVRKCGIASPVNLLVGIIWRGGISHTIIVQKGIRCSCRERALRARILDYFTYVVSTCRALSRTRSYLYFIIPYIRSCHRGCGVRGAHLGAPAPLELRSSRVVRVSYYEYS